MILEKTKNPVQVIYGHGEPPLDDMVPGGIAINFTDGEVVIKGETKSESIKIVEFGDIIPYLKLKSLEQSKKNNKYDEFIKIVSEEYEDVIGTLNFLNISIKNNVKKINDAELLSWQNIEYTSEFIRQEKNTGVMYVNQIGVDIPEPTNQPIDTAYSALNIHNHPNYRGMPGMGWFTYNVNGYLGGTRHNDYILKKQGNGFMKTELNLAPDLKSDFSISDMQTLFQKYVDGTLSEDEKYLFRWDISYLESWWQEIDTLDDMVSDTFESFRHTYGKLKPTQISNYFTTSMATGKKARFENIPFFPFASKSINNDGEVKYSILMYRIVSFPVDSLNGMKWDKVLEEKDDAINRARFNGVDVNSTRAKFKFKDEINLDSIIETIPSIGGADEEIVDYKTIDGHNIMEPKNKSFYHRKYTMGSDAVGRGAYKNGWNDPTLITGFTKEKQVMHGVSYMVPLEMILRTPLENWNPNNLEVKDVVSGKGTMDEPLDGIKYNGKFYTTPYDFYKGFDNADPADTGNGVVGVLNKDNVVTKNVGGGIYIILPTIDNVTERVRVRFPIFWNAHEYSFSNVLTSALDKENKERMAILKLESLQQSKKNDKFDAMLSSFDDKFSEVLDLKQKYSKITEALNEINELNDYMKLKTLTRS